MASNCSDSNLRPRKSSGSTRKICSPKWVHLPQIGMNIKNIWNHTTYSSHRFETAFSDLLKFNCLRTFIIWGPPTYCHCGSTAHLAKDAFNGAWICDAARSWACVQEQVCNAARLTPMNTNHKAVDMVNIPLFTRLYTCQVVQDFFHQQ